jgi:type IV pilus secretin PilQ/predicted competence protein
MKRDKLMIMLSIMVLALFFVGGTAFSSFAERGSPVKELATITKIDIHDDTLEITGDRPFVYFIYKPSDPYRVVVEIPDAQVGSFRDVMKSSSSEITEIMPTQVDLPKPTAKIEVLLQSPYGVDSQYRNNSLILKVKKEEPAPQMQAQVQTEKAEPVPAPEVKPETSPNAEENVSLPKATEITNISFDSSNGMVKLFIKANGSISPTVFTLKNRIVIDIPDVTLRAAVPSTVMSPVKGIRAGKHKDKVRLVVDLKESRDFDVLPVRDTVIIALRAPEAATVAVVKKEMPQEPAKVMMEEKRPEPRPEPRAVEKMEVVEPETLAEGKYTGQKISLDFQDSDIVPIFRLLSDISGYNIVVNPDVKGKLTMKLINVPWDQALDLILKTFSLGKSVEGNIIRIAPLAVFAKESDEKQRAREAEVKAEPLETKVFPISYADVSVVEKAIKDSKILTPRGSISVDKRTSSMTIKDAESVFPQVDSLLQTLDKPTLQVMIEARIVELNTNYERDLGIQWGMKFNAKNTLSSGGGLTSLNKGSFTGNPFIVDFPSAGAAAGSGTGIAFGIMNAAKTFGLDLQLSALETTGNGKIISNPRIMTVDNEKAKILQGKSIPVRKLTTEGTISTEFKDVVLELNVTPHITPDRSVSMKVEIKKEDLDPTIPSIEGVPGTDKKEANTNVLIKDGETIVIGGMYKINKNNQQSGVPWLKNIPVLGSLFKNNSETVQTTELLIFVTPRIVEKP